MQTSVSLCQEPCMKFEFNWLSGLRRCFNGQNLLVSMIHNKTLQTSPRHREEETQNATVTLHQKAIEVKQTALNSLAS